MDIASALGMVLLSGWMGGDFGRIAQSQRPEPQRAQGVILAWGCPVSRASLTDYALNEEPQPQVDVALGFLNTNPRPITSSLKSISVPSR